MQLHLKITFLGGAVKMQVTNEVKEVQEAEVLMAQGKHKDAQPVLAQALTALEKSWYPEHPKLAHILDLLVACADKQNNLEEALAFAQRSLGIKQKSLKGDHPEILGTALQIAEFNCRLNKWPEAEAALKQAQKAADSALAPVENIQFNLAFVLRKQGKNEEAAKAYADAAEGFRQRYKFPELAACLDAHAELAKEMGKTDEAETLESDARFVRKQLVAKTRYTPHDFYGEISQVRT